MPLATAGRHHQSGIRGLLGELLDYALATGRLPNRDSSPTRYLAASAEWHARFRQRGAPDPRTAPLALPLPPRGAWKDQRWDAEVVPLTTATAIVEEGQRMHHCVSTRLPDVVAGRAAIFRARVAAQWLTVELRRRGEGWRLGDVRGFANRSPTVRERNVLKRWMLGGESPTTACPSVPT